jgi:lysozyme
MNREAYSAGSPAETGCMVVMAALFFSAVFGLWSITFDTPPEIKPEPIQQTEIVLCSLSYSQAVDHIKEYEGLRLVPYTCGDWSYIGYGHQITSDKWMLNGITEHQADSILRSDLNKRITYVNKTYQLSGDRCLAVAMLYYNVSPRSIRSSQLHAELLKPVCDEINVIDSWLSLCKFRGIEHLGLKKRRAYELKLFLNDKN